MSFKKIQPLDGVYVEIAGMGGAINFPSALIHAALELAGYEVEMNNDYNEPDTHWYVDKEDYKLMLQGKKDFPGNVKKKPKVQVLTKHYPWPG